MMNSATGSFFFGHKHSLNGFMSLQSSLLSTGAVNDGEDANYSLENPWHKKYIRLTFQKEKRVLLDDYEDNEGHTVIYSYKSDSSTAKKMNKKLKKMKSDEQEETVFSERH